MANTRVVSFHAEGIKTREVWNMKYTLSQQTDVEGQPTGCTRGGKITVKVKARDDGNNDMLEWMADSFLSKDGYISFPNHQGGEMKQLKFKEAYMIEYTESYDNDSKNPMMEEFVITAKEIRVGNVLHKNQWTLDF